MTPSGAKPDPVFLNALGAPLHGRFAVELDPFSPAFVEAQFRKIVKQPDLVANDGIMDNLMFAVRKKDILVLRPDVFDVLTGLSLKPLSEVSALKTLYALGSEQDRYLVDERYARRLFADMKATDGLPSDLFLGSASRIGGPKTMTILKTILQQASANQKEAEARKPRDYARVAQLDQVRSKIASEIQLMTRKQLIMAYPEPRRSMELWELARKDATPLGFWAYQELASHPSAARAEVIRRTAPVPVDALNLLRKMNAPLSPEEEALIKKGHFTPPDWEAILDRQ